jgi:hypothetical protein
MMLGSIAEKVLRTSARSVLTVPPRAPGHLELPFQEVLFPVDFSTAPETGSARLSVAEAGDANLTILHVLESVARRRLRPRHFNMPEFRRGYRAWAIEELTALCRTTPPTAAGRRPASRRGSRMSRSCRPRLMTKPT